MKKQKSKILQSFNNKNNGQHHVKVHISFMAGDGRRRKFQSRFIGGSKKLHRYIFNFILLFYYRYLIKHSMLLD